MPSPSIAPGHIINFLKPLTHHVHSASHHQQPSIYIVVHTPTSMCPHHSKVPECSWSSQIQRVISGIMDSGSMRQIMAISQANLINIIHHQLPAPKCCCQLLSLYCWSKKPWFAPVYLICANFHQLVILIFSTNPWGRLTSHDFLVVVLAKLWSDLSVSKDQGTNANCLNSNCPYDLSSFSWNVMKLLAKCGYQIMIEIMLVGYYTKWKPVGSICSSHQITTESQ